MSGRRSEGQRGFVWCALVVAVGLCLVAGAVGADRRGHVEGVEVVDRIDFRSGALELAGVRYRVTERTRMIDADGTLLVLRELTATNGSRESHGDRVSFEASRGVDGSWELLLLERLDGDYE